MLRLLFSLIGYVCTATVITLALGVGYLLQTDRLNEEKMFRMVALLHDVDLEKMAETQANTDEEIPPEEVSLDEVLRQQLVLDRNFEVKLLALERGRQEYELSLQQLKEQTERYDRVARDWQDTLKQQEELTTQENLAKVVSDLEQVKPAIAKDLLMRWIEEGRMDDAILLVSKMSEGKKAKLLKSFEAPEELDKLHEMHRMMVSGGPGKPRLDQALDELDALESSGN